MDYDKSKIKTYIIISTYTVILAAIVLNYQKFFGTVGQFVSLFSPFIVAICIAFVLNIPMTFIEKRILSILDKPKYANLKKFKRPIAIVLTLLTFILLLSGFILFVVPQLADSISTLTKTVPDYLARFETMLSQNIDSNLALNDIWEKIVAAWQDIFSFASKFFSGALTQILDITVSVTNGVVNFFLAIVFSIYMLASKEKLIRHLKKLIYAFIKKDFCDKLLYVGKLSNKVFSSFIAGQCTEAVIIGTLCTIGMSILGMPYALLIGVLVGVTSLIPVFGAFIGTIPSAFLILLIEPMQAFWFIVFIIVLQQVEGNFIYPRVVGSSIGLPAIWTMLAILVGGGLFGVLGMLLGLPTFGVIYQLLREKTSDKLEEKEINIE